MGRGFGENQRLLLDALNANPQYLIISEVLLWWLFGDYEDNLGYQAAYARFNAVPPGTDLPWTGFEAISVRRSLRNLRDKELIKGWGHGRYIPLLNGHSLYNTRNESFWSAASCEGAKNHGFVLAYRSKIEEAA
jgi:hypothetical protein